MAPATLAADGEDGVRRLDPDERDRAKLLPADAASWALMLHQVLVPAASAGPGPNRGDV